MLKKIDFQAEITLNNIIKLLKIRLRFFIIFISISIIVVAAYSFIIPENYQASASVLPPEQQSGGGGLSSFLQSFSGGGLAMGGLSQGNKSMVFLEILKSREVAKFIIDSLHLRENPYFKTLKDEEFFELFRNIIDIQLNKSGIIYLYVTLSTPYFPGETDRNAISKLASDIANSAIVGLDFINRTKNTSKAIRKRKFIEKILVQKKYELDSIDINLESFQKQNKVLSLEKQTQSIVTNAISIGSELAKAEIEMNIKMQEFEPNSPVVLSFKNIVANLREQYKRIQSGGLTSNDAFSIPLSEVPELLKVYTNLLRDQKILEQVNIYLETQKYQEAIQGESDIPIVETLDIAIPPLIKYSPNRRLMVTFGFVLSVLFSASIVLISAFLNKNLYIKSLNNQA